MPFPKTEGNADRPDFNPPSISRRIKPAFTLDSEFAPLPGMPVSPAEECTNIMEEKMAAPVPTAKEIRAKSAEMGLLNMQLYVYFTTPTGDLGPVMENLKEHLEFQGELEKKGIMFGAGPHWDDNEEYWTGEGMVIIRANSLAEAREIAASDPMHKSGARKFTVRPWLMNEGCLTINFSFSQGKRELV